MPVSKDDVRKVARLARLNSAHEEEAQRQSPDNMAALDALDRLQTSLCSRQVDLAEWEQDATAERHATAQQRIPEL